MKIKISFVVLVAVGIFFSSCGGGGAGASGGTTTWGIDQNSGTLIPVCNGDQNTTTNAIIVQPNQIVTHTKENTVVRIWHYQDGTKKVCTVQGEAIIQ